jgi:hypothetical protein
MVEIAILRSLEAQGLITKDEMNRAIEWLLKNIKKNAA